MNLAALTSETLGAQVGTEFRLAPDEADGEAITLVLAAVTRAGARAPGATRDPFSLRLRGPADPMLPQAIRPLQHDVLGRLDIFLVPIARDAEGTVYEAVFS